MCNVNDKRCKVPQISAAFSNTICVLKNVMNVFKRLFKALHSWYKYASISSGRLSAQVNEHHAASAGLKI